jgi:hypothetical protein
VGPLVKRIWWLAGRVLILGLTVALIFAGGPWAAPVMWAIFGYIFTRALPGIRADVGRVRGLLRLEGGRYSVRRGEF